jgi:nitrile hydratase accessory protein
LSLPDHPPGMAAPVFAQPWQASAFAMTVALHQRGLFGWSEWAAVLGEEVKRGDDYYAAWLRALERLVVAKQVTAVREIDAVTQAWQRAAHATPHGQPILLENDPASH